MGRDKVIQDVYMTAYCVGYVGKEGIDCIKRNALH